MKHIKILIFLLFSINLFLLLFLVILEVNHYDQFNKYSLLAVSNLDELTKIKISDSDEDLYNDKLNLNKAENKKVSVHSPNFVLPEQARFWNRWQYSLLSSMRDKHFYSSMSQVKNVSFYSSGFFNKDWLQDVYYPFSLNQEGLLDLEVLIISWDLSEKHYKVTLQYDFYHSKTNKRYLEHVVNIIFAR